MQKIRNLGCFITVLAVSVSSWEVSGQGLVSWCSPASGSLTDGSRGQEGSRGIEKLKSQLRPDPQTFLRWWMGYRRLTGAVAFPSSVWSTLRPFCSPPGVSGFLPTSGKVSASEQPLGLFQSVRPFACLLLGPTADHGCFAWGPAFPVAH